MSTMSLAGWLGLRGRLGVPPPLVGPTASTQPLPRPHEAASSKSDKDAGERRDFRGHIHGIAIAAERGIGVGLVLIYAHPPSGYQP
jgi:hypothetical protein